MDTQTLIAVGTLIIAAPFYLFALVLSVAITGFFAEGAIYYLAGRDAPKSSNPIHILLLGLATMAVIGFLFP